MTAMVERDPAAVQFVRETLSAPVTSMWPLDRVVDHLRRDETEDVVVLGPSVTDEEARAFAEHSMIHRPALGVIRIRADNAVLADAFRAGMSAVVESGDATELRNAVRRAGALARARRRAASGGCGAGPAGAAPHRLRHQGWRGQEPGGHQPRGCPADQGHSVCIVDLDIHGVTSRSCCSCPRCTPWGSVPDPGRHRRQRCPVPADGALRRALRASRPGPGGGAGRGRADRHGAGGAQGHVRRRGRRHLGSVRRVRLEALDHTDLLVLVGTLDIPALKSLKLATGTLDLLNFPRDRMAPALNRADSKVGLSALGVRGDTGGQRHRQPPVRSRRAHGGQPRRDDRAGRGHQVSKTLTSFAASLVRAAVPQPLDAAAPSWRGGSVAGPTRSGWAEMALLDRLIAAQRDRMASLPVASEPTSTTTVTSPRPPPCETRSRT